MSTYLLTVRALLRESQITVFCFHLGLGRWTDLDPLFYEVTEVQYTQNKWINNNKIRGKYAREVATLFLLFYSGWRKLVIVILFLSPHFFLSSLTWLCREIHIHRKVLNEWAILSTSILSQIFSPKTRIWGTDSICIWPPAFHIPLLNILVLYLLHNHCHVQPS